MSTLSLCKMIEKTFCTTREAAKLLGISVRTVQLWVENGLLSAWKTAGGHRRVSRDAVESLLHKVVALPATINKATPEHGLKVLIVEDDVDLLRLYQARLSQWPMFPKVVVASNGFEALVKVGREVPDLLIADLGMAEMDGFRMLRLLKAMPELDNMAIVVVSGLSAEEISRRGGIPEGIPILPKPIPFNALLEIALHLKAGKLAEGVSR